MRVVDAAGNIDKHDWHIGNYSLGADVKRHPKIKSACKVSYGEYSMSRVGPNLLFVLRD